MSSPTPVAAARGVAVPPWAHAVPAWFGPAAVGLAVGAAALVLGQAAGLALAAVAAGLVVAVAVAAPRPHRLWAAIAALLALTPVVRAADWVVALGLCGAFALAAVAVAGASTWRDVLGAPLRGLVAVLPGPVLVLALATRRAAGRWARAVPLVRGMMLAATLVLVFGGLFAAADAAFEELVEDVTRALPDVGDRWFGRLMVGLLVAGAAGALVKVAHRPALPAAPVRARLTRAEWLGALAALDLLFAVFVAVQLTILFGGHEHVVQTAGLTYSEYARRGFGELVVAAALTLGVIGAVRLWARDERALRVLLALLCLCTGVVLASAHRRLGLYVEAYGETRLRLLAEGQILWLGGLFALLLVAPRAAWLPRAAVTLSAVFALAFVALNPDARIAARNLERTGPLDLAYLQTLSADALPVLAGVPEVAGDTRENLRVQRDGIAGWNLGRERARRLLTPR